MEEVTHVSLKNIYKISLLHDSYLLRGRTCFVIALVIMIFAMLQECLGEDWSNSLFEGKIHLVVS